MKVRISPIFYMGNKKKLIKKGMVDLFPNNINKFIEPFGGSAIVSMNVQANEYYISDIDENLVSLYQLFKYTDVNVIINHIDNRIEEFKLPKERTRRCDFIGREDAIEEYKQSYFKFREHYNKNKQLMDFYTLMFFSFSQQFRFNRKGEFNMPFGTDCFSDKNREYVKDGCSFFSQDNVCIGRSDFRTLNIDLLNEDDFVYLDPPYLNTTATYNENEGWTLKDEKDMQELCERLNEKNIKFALSNVFSNKNMVNQQLIDWCDKNNLNVYAFDKVVYPTCGKKSSNVKEVLITNYTK